MWPFTVFKQFGCLRVSAAQDTGRDIFAACWSGQSCQAIADFMFQRCCFKRCSPASDLYHRAGTRQVMPSVVFGLGIFRTSAGVLLHFFGVSQAHHFEEVCGWPD